METFARVEEGNSIVTEFLLLFVIGGHVPSFESREKRFSGATLAFHVVEVRGEAGRQWTSTPESAAAGDVRQ